MSPPGLLARTPPRFARLIPQLLAAAIVACLCTAARASDAQIVYYDISGNTATALRRQLDARGPLGESGKHFDAHTDWRVSWNYRYRAGLSGCEFTALDVSTSGTILLPRWIHAADVPDSLLRKWQAYTTALLAHEQGHYAHATEAAGEITRLEQSFGGYSGDCAAMARAFNARADAIIQKYKAQDVAYDDATGHGRTQGATFP